MELAFIVGMVLGSLIGGLYIRSVMSHRSYERCVEENRRIQLLLDDLFLLIRNYLLREKENKYETHRT